MAGGHAEVLRHPGHGLLDPVDLGAALEHDVSGLGDEVEHFGEILRVLGCQGVYRTRILRPTRSVVFGVMLLSLQSLVTVVWYLIAILPRVSPLRMV